MKTFIKECFQDLITTVSNMETFLRDFLVILVSIGEMFPRNYMDGDVYQQFQNHTVVCDPSRTPSNHTTTSMVTYLKRVQRTIDRMATNCLNEPDEKIPQRSSLSIWWPHFHEKTLRSKINGVSRGDKYRFKWPFRDEWNMVNISLCL